VRSLRSRATADGPLRSRPWRGQREVALVAPVGAAGVALEAVRACLERLGAEGYERVLTAAIAPSEQAPFLASGFEVRERLHLLSHDLRALPVGRGGRTRRARESDRPAVLGVDDAAFPQFWRMGPEGLDDALDATPTARFRVVEVPAGQLQGYAITGRAGARAYLQRLAVHPDRQGSGLGTTLVADGLRWARRWGAREVLVNTQVGNEGAVRLYEQLGFRRCDEGLAVLERSIGGVA
jgi:ribosomal protein S18 acetylase RimI-like enzyme